MLVALKECELTLLDLGPHDRESTWDRIRNKKQWIREHMEKRLPVPHLIANSASRLVSLESSDGWNPFFPGEDTAEWVSFLDVQQHEAVSTICASVEDHTLEGKGDAVCLILGGPGTGKTVVLLRLLEKLIEQRLDVGFSCSGQVHAYLESSAQHKIPNISADDTMGPQDALLYDDPSSLAEIAVSTNGAPRTLVFALDPLQLAEMPTTTELKRLRMRTRARVIELTTCYRQRRKLAERVVHMTDLLARSNPYLDKTKKVDFSAEYGELLQQFNTLELYYPLGDFKVLKNPSKDLPKRIEELFRTRLWSHWPPILMVLDEAWCPEVPKELAKIKKSS
ncbi:MAG TPA: DNA/RNA helicase domain-containing protein, partial [Gemmatimonadales bacterium]